MSEKSCLNCAKGWSNSGTCCTDTGCFSGGRHLRWERVEVIKIIDLPTPTEKTALLPTDAVTRKATPITSGVLDYFPLALAEVAQCSKAGNDQHNPGQPLHWARDKSTDHADCMARHLIDRGTRDTDGIRHSAKLAWRALAALQVELEAAKK